jgi:class 3 adenylate cyclase
MSESPEQETRGRRFLETARRFNRNPKLLAAVRRSRERALGDEEFVAHLSAARGRPADVAARQVVVLGGDERGLLGEIGLTAAQAWQRLAERQDRGRGKVDVAVMFTDLVGFSSWALDAGDRAAIRLLGEVADAIEPPIASHRGEVVKRLGDGLMAAFWSVDGAAAAAFEGCERAAAIEFEGFRPQLRTGIHLGRPRRIGGDYLGVDVNIAARLCDAARPGEVLVSGAALADLEPGAVSASKRRFRAKGAPRDLDAHVIEPAG